MDFKITDLNLEEGTGFLPSFYSDVAPEMPYLEYGIKLTPFAEYLLSLEPHSPEVDRTSMKQKPFLEITKKFLSSKGYSSEAIRTPYNEPILYAQPKRKILESGSNGADDTFWFDLTNLDGIRIFFPDIEESPVRWDDASPRILDIILGYGRILALIQKEIPDKVLHPKAEPINKQFSYHELIASA